MTVYSMTEVGVATVLQVTPDELPTAIRGLVRHIGSTRKVARHIDAKAREQGSTRGDQAFVSHSWVASQTKK